MRGNKCVILEVSNGIKPKFQAHPLLENLVKELQERSTTVPMSLYVPDSGNISLTMVIKARRESRQSLVLTVLDQAHLHNPHSLARVILLLELLSNVYFVTLERRHFFNPVFVHSLSEFVSRHRDRTFLRQWPLHVYVLECELYTDVNMSMDFEALCSGLAQRPVEMPVMVRQVMNSGLFFTEEIGRLLMGRRFCHTLYLPNIQNTTMDFFNTLIEVWGN